ncbi:MAG: alpha/beta hydrolase [Pseudomonadota bacterium]
MTEPTYHYSYERARNGDKRTLVLLHGTGGDDESFMGLGRIVAPDAARIAIRGDVNEMGNLRFFRRLGDGVYDMDDLAMRTERLGEFIPSVLAEHGREPEHAFGMGYSNGANILSNLMFVKPAIMGGAVIMHPLIPFEPVMHPKLNGKPVLITFGSNDPITPPGHGDKVAEWFEMGGAEVSRFSHTAGHNIPPVEIEAISGWLAGETLAVA